MRMRYSNPPDIRLQLTSDPNRKRRRESGNVMIMFTMMLPFALLPLVGLAIDGTMLYSVEAKLQSAVDGAALAAAQSLSAGLSTTAQQSAAVLAADQFIRANIRTGATAGTGYWGAFNLNDSNCATANGWTRPTGSGISGGVTYANSGNCMWVTQDNVNKLRSVSIVASVQVPLLFMRILGFSNGTVSASATASRRDVVMVLVIDRSGSMSAELSAVQAGAAYFVSQFSALRDKLGLVLIGGSSIVAYPPTDWNTNPPTGAGGPDVNFKSTSVSPNMLDSIAAMKSGSNTGTAEGLMLAYKELQAANQPGALNIIVLWTDGAPNGFTADFNNGATGSVKATGSGCTYTNGATGTSATGVYPAVATKSMLGWMAQQGGYSASSNSITGVFSRAQTYTSGYTVSSWVASSSTEPLLSGGGAAGCSFGSGGNTVSTVVNIPSVDYYGNSTQGSNVAPYTQSDYKQGNLWTATANCNSGVGTGVGGVPLKLSGTFTGNSSSSNSPSANACQVGLASWNAADMVGRLIHQDTTLTPVIYTMGYAGTVSGNGGIDTVFLQRLSNCKPGVPCGPGGANATNTVYTATGTPTVYNTSGTIPTGMYLQIQTVDDVTPAFQILLSQILRLAF